MNSEQATRLQQDWLEACESIGIPAITLDTSARLMAIVYVHGGGEEEMVLNRKFTNDVQYIQRRFHLQGGERPDETFVVTMKHYVRELERYMKEREHTVTPQPADAAPQTSAVSHQPSDSSIPDWAHRLMRDRYGMKLHG